MNQYIKNLKQLFPAILLIVSTLFYYVPSLIYFPNRDDFSDQFLVLVLPILMIVIIISIVFGFVLALTPKKILCYLTAVMLTGAILLWLQGDYFVTNYGVLDGSELDFNHFNQRGYYELGIIALVIIFSIVFNKIINKQLPFIVILISIGQIAIVSYNSYIEPNDKNSIEQVNDEFFNYSTKKNVILVILDTFGGDYFSQMRQQNPSITDDLTGFVNYTDAMSNYPITHGSLPSLLTGKMIPHDITFTKYFHNDIPTTALPYQFEKKGYLVSVISVYSWFDKLYKKMYMFEPSIDPSILKKYYGLRLFDMATFRSMPHFLKPYIFNDGSWVLSNTLARLAQIPSLRPEKAEYMLNLVTTKMKTTTAHKRFKMVHVVLPHPKFVFDENCSKLDSKKKLNQKELMLGQSKCAFKRLKEYLNKLKKLNIYDSSFIAVISDHGARVITDKSIHGFPSYFEMESSSTLFMLKGINQKEIFEDIDTPVSLIKLYDLFMNEKLHEKKIDFLSDYHRKFYAFNVNNKVKNNYLADAPLYEVGKNNRDPKSWKLKKLVTHKCPLEKIPLTVRFEKNGREEYCAKFGFSRPSSNGSGTWTESNDIRIILNLDLKDKEKKSQISFNFNFKPSFTVSHKQLDLSWYINGHLITSSQHSKANDTNIDFKVPLAILLEKELIEVKIMTSKLYSQKDLFNTHPDTRKLGIFMQSIEIE